MVSKTLKTSLLLLTLVCSLFIFSCKKSSTPTVTPQQFFETNVIDQSHVVNLATDRGTDVTFNYNGYTFRINKTTPLNGSFVAANNLFSVTGTWVITSDYEQITFNLPTAQSSFAFFNRAWKFTNRSAPIFELVPVDNTDIKVLRFQKQ